MNDNQEILNNTTTPVETQYVDENINKLFNLIEKNRNNDKNTLHIIVSYGVAQNRLVNTIETLGGQDYAGRHCWRYRRFSLRIR